MARETTLSSLRLSKPLSKEVLRAPQSRSMLFWRDIRNSAIALVAVFGSAWLWSFLGLPSFELNGAEHQWILPLQIFGDLYAARTMISAFAEERGRRSARRTEALIGLFELEIFPFIEAELAKIDNSGGHGLTLPPRDWLVQTMSSGGADGAHWNSRYRGTEEFLSFSALLQNGGTEALFAVEYPDGV